MKMLKKINYVTDLQPDEKFPIMLAKMNPIFAYIIYLKKRIEENPTEKYIKDFEYFVEIFRKMNNL